MSITPLPIEGSYLFQSPTHEDERGYSVEWFKSATVKEFLSREFTVAQASLSKSKQGVLRGIHFSLAPLGQAKWVTCVTGAILDVVVDIRPNSPTFKCWDAHELRAGDGTSMFITEGLGHAYLALEENTTVTYLLSSIYLPKFERVIDPLDPDIAIAWPDIRIILSERDASAPSLRTFLSSSD